MRITGRDKACGTAFSYRVDKIDFLITEVCPEVGEKEEEEASMAYIAIATYTLSTNSLTPACVYTLPISLSISLRLYEISFMEYIAASQRLFCGLSPRRFPVTIFSFSAFSLC